MADARNKQEQDWSLSPFAMMRQGVDELDRWFSRVTGDRTSPGPRMRRRWRVDRSMCP